MRAAIQVRVNPLEDVRSRTRLPAASRQQCPSEQTAPQARKATLPLIAAVFLVTLFLPWFWSIGPVVVSPFRLVLLVTLPICLFIWASGKAGGIRAADIAILLYCLWCAVSLFVVHNAQISLQSGGIMFVETMGAYLMGRCFIRGPQQFRAMTRLLFWIVALLSPLAVMELISNADVALDLFSKFSPVHPVVYGEPRWGLRRVQSVFEHPILFGVSTGAILGLVHLVLGSEQSFAKRWLLSAVVVITSCLSLSSGPLTALLVQIFLIAWAWFFRNNNRRWQMLWALVISIYTLISLVSNQTVPEFLFTHFTFDAQSATYRVLIWNFGSESALNHPLFGVGFNRWDRPDWMPGSIDMFWLYHAVLFGIPAAIFMLMAFFLTILPISRLKNLDETLTRYRLAFLIVMTGYFLVGWTVHFWNATYALYLFLLGSGAWLADSRPKATRGQVRDQTAPAGERGGKRTPAATQRRRM